MWRGTIDWPTTITQITRTEGKIWRTQSGKWSDIEYDMWRLYEQSDLYSRACRDLRRKANIGTLDKGTRIIGLERDGIPMALELARQTGASPGFASKTSFDHAELREFKLPARSRVYLVVDVHHMGSTYLKIRRALEPLEVFVEDPLLTFVNRSGYDRFCLWPEVHPQASCHDRSIVSLLETDERGWDFKDWPVHLLHKMPAA